jgi:PAS domain S-box-containing protein
MMGGQRNEAMHQVHGTTRQRARLFAALVAVLTAAVCALVLWQVERAHVLMRQQAVAEAEQRSVQLAEAMAGQMGGLLGNVDLALQQLRREWGGDLGHFDLTARTILDALPSGAVTHVSVVGADGTVVYNSLNASKHTYVGDREHFQAQQSGGDRLMIGKPVLSRLGNTWTFVVNRPILRGGHFAGTVNISVSSAFVSRKLATLQLSDKDTIALLYSDGSFMARSQDLLGAMGKGVPLDRPFLAPGAPAHGVYRMPGISDQQPRIYAWHRLQEYGLITAIGLAEENVLAPLAAGIKRDHIISTSLVALVAVLGGFIVLLLLQAARKQEQIAASEAFRKRVFDSSPIPVVVMDVETFTYIDCNPAAVAIYRYPSRAQTLGKTPLDVSAPLQEDGTPSADKARVYIAQALAAGSCAFEWRHQRPNGEVWDAEVHMMSFQSGLCRLLQFTLQDITAKKQAQQALRESEQRYRIQVEHAPEAIVIFDAGSGVFVEVNENALGLFGLSREALLRSSPMELSPPLQPDGRPSVQMAQERIREALAGGTPVFEWMHRNASGQDIPCELRLVRLPYSGRDLVRGSITDISARKRAEQALHESETRFRLLFEQVPTVAVQGYTQDGTVRYWNRASERLYGYSKEEAIGRNLLDLIIPPSLHDAVRQAVQHMLESGQAAPTEEMLLMRKDGTRVAVFSSHVILESASGGRELYCLDVDLTERKRTEAALQLTQFSLDRAPEGVFWINREARLSYVNDEACHSLGYTREEMLGLHVWDFDPDFTREKWPQHWESMRQVGARTIMTHHQHKDGTRHPVEISVVQTTYGDQEHHTAFVRDITQRKADEEILGRDREQQTVLREMLEDVLKGKGLKETLATCLTRVMAVSWLALLPKGGIFLMDKDRKTLQLAVSHNLSPEILSMCDRVPLGRCHCGHAAASRQMQFSSCVDHHHEISYAGMPDHGHYNLPLLSEGEVLGVMALYLPHGFARNPAKEQFLTTVADVLAGFIRRRHAEISLKRLNEELEDRVEERTLALLAAKEEAEQSSRAKSEFLSRMSHELRTPLNAILGFGQLLELELHETEQADNVQEILHAGRHLLELINEVLDLARIEAGRLSISREPVPLMPLVEECLTLIRPLAESRGIRIAEAVSDCGEHVLADRVRLKQIVLNLLSNAVKYNREGGGIGIACVGEDDAIQIRVSDTGAGLSPEQQARLFVAFERLDADQNAIEGTGIGLAFSKHLVGLMGGEIGVESLPGQGSTFWLRLPGTEGHQEPAHPAAGESGAESIHPAGHSLWEILCIEDNPANLRLVERFLARRDDIRLLTAATPTLGLKLARSQHPALILLDINLPEMDGYEVMDRLRQDPVTRDIPVVAISANAMPDDLARGRSAGFKDYLTKPLSLENLLRTVNETLAQPASGPASSPE